MSSNRTTGRKFLTTGLAAAVAVLAAPAMAAPNYGAIAISDGTTLTPALTISARTDDNIFNTDGNEDDDVITTIAPSLALEAGSGRTVVRATYAGSYGIYQDSSDDDFDDHVFGLSLNRTGGQVELELDAERAYGHDDRGTGPSDGLGAAFFNAPSEYEDTSFGAGLEFGGGGDTRLGLSFDQFDREYQNFRAITRARDYDRQQWGLSLSRAMSATTEMRLNASFADTEYDFTPAGAASLDSSTTRITGGVAWNVSSTLSADVSLGWKEKDFEANARDTTDGATWGANINWRPRSYSQISFGAQNSFQETSTNGDAINRSTFDIQWRHEWTDRLSSTAQFSLENDDYEGDNREDDTTNVSAQLSYDMVRWATVSGGVTHISRDSSDAGRDFDRTQFQIQLQMGI